MVMLLLDSRGEAKGNHQLPCNAIRKEKKQHIGIPKGGRYGKMTRQSHLHPITDAFIELVNSAIATAAHVSLRRLFFEKGGGSPVDVGR
jgi:hypothetical protein